MTEAVYEIAHGSVAPARIPAMLQAVLSKPRLYSSSVISEVLGMTCIRLSPEKITPAPETDEAQALGVLLGLTDPGVEEKPFLVGFRMKDSQVLRPYVQRPGVPLSSVSTYDSPRSPPR